MRPLGIRMQQEERRTENWIVPGIIVKVLNKKVGGGRFYKKKGRVDRVLDDFIGRQTSKDVFDGCRQSSPIHRIST
jgi:hypothetical protein